MEQLVEGLADDQPDSYLVANIGTLEHLRKLTATPIYGDCFLNPWNTSAVDFLREEGISSFTPGAELSLPLLQNLAAHLITADEEPGPLLTAGHAAGILPHRRPYDRHH